MNDIPIKSGICHNCGAKLLSERSNSCFSCGAQHNTVMIMLANKIMEERKLNSVSLTQNFKFENDMSDSGKFNEGLILLENMKLREALDYYDKAIKSNPQVPELWNNFGVAFMGLSNCQDALSCYLKSVELNPNYLE